MYELDLNKPKEPVRTQSLLSPVPAREIGSHEFGRLSDCTIAYGGVPGYFSL